LNQVRSSKRAKPLSVVASLSPCSMARAARCASGTSLACRVGPVAREVTWSLKEVRMELVGVAFIGLAIVFVVLLRVLLLLDRVSKQLEVLHDELLAERSDVGRGGR
jgi:hypothetical protein